MARALKNRIKNLASHPKGATFLPLLLLLLAGCASGGKGPRALFPVLDDRTPEMKKMGYAPHGRYWTFAVEGASVTVSHAAPDNTAKRLGIVDGLAGKGFVLVKMEVENLSQTNKITYNPALTALMTDSLDYMKPLDYTDFYDLVKDDAKARNTLAALGAVIYDNTQTIKPGEKVSKFLVFPPPSKHYSSAVLEIKELYIGTKSVSISFPFKSEELKEPLP